MRTFLLISALMYSALLLTGVAYSQPVAPAPGAPAVVVNKGETITGDKLRAAPRKGNYRCRSSVTGKYVKFEQAQQEAATTQCTKLH